MDCPFEQPGEFQIVMEILGFLGVGILAGTLGGLLGIGGGIVLMPVLRFFAGLSPALAAGTCILAVLFTTLGGSYRHWKLGHVNVRSIVPIILSGAAATCIFSLLFLCLTTRQKWLDLGTGLVFSFVAIRMILEGVGWSSTRTDSDGGNEIRGSLSRKVLVGSAAGILPGLLGIGTGAILVPAFTFAFRAPIKVAMGSSLLCFTANSLLSSTFKFSQGFTAIPLAVPVCLGTLIGSNIGAVLNRRFPSSALKLLFGVLFSYVSLKFILLFFRHQI